jgi:hypothetical protein
MLRNISEVGEIGSKYMNRIWTLRVPETTKIPFDRNNNTITEIVPTVVKAYTCEVERVKEGNRGSYNLEGNLDSTIIVLASTIERKWNLAIMNGHDTSTYELTPEHWASYLAVKDSQTAPIEEVPVQIDISCISIHPIYILLICVYAIMIIYELILYKSDLKVPSGVIGWASHIVKNLLNLIMMTTSGMDYLAIILSLLIREI